MMISRFEIRGITIELNYVFPELENEGDGMWEPIEIWEYTDLNPKREPDRYVSFPKERVAWLIVTSDDAGRHHKWYRAYPYVDRDTGNRFVSKDGPHIEELEEIERDEFMELSRKGHAEQIYDMMEDEALTSPGSR